VRACTRARLCVYALSPGTKANVSHPSALPFHTAYPPPHRPRDPCPAPRTGHTVRGSEPPVLSGRRGDEAARAGARATCRADVRPMSLTREERRNGGRNNTADSEESRKGRKLARAIVRTRRVHVRAACTYVRTYAARCAVMGYVMDDRTGVRRSGPTTTPRTVIGTGESESAPAVADSLVHKCDGRCHLFPSRPLLSLSPDPVSSLSPLPPSLPPSLPAASPSSLSPSPSCSRAAYSRRRPTRARSRPIASDVPVRYPRARI